MAITLCTTSQATVTGYIGPKDITKLHSVLVKALIYEGTDVLSPYYGAKGFKLIKENVVKVLKMDNCAHLKAHYKTDLAPEIQFNAIAAWSLLECTGQLYNEASLKGLRAILENEKATVADIRYALETLTFLGQNIPNAAKVAALIQNRLKEDDSLPSLGHALHSGALLGAAGKFALDRVEDVVVQADEIDGKLLQWEGGLSVTSMLITGLLRLPGAKPLNQIQAEKLGNYLISRKTVQTPKGALALLEAAEALVGSSVSPVSISVQGSSLVTTDKPELRVRVSDLLGRALKPAPTPVVAQSATRIVDDVVVLAKQQLNPTQTPTEFILPLKLDPGYYKIALLAGTHSTSFNVRVLGPIALKSIEIGLTDADSAPKLNTVLHPDKLKATLQADGSQHLVVKFALARVVHQAFLRLFAGNQDIIFVVEPDNNKIYKLNVALGTEFTESGLFDMELILGDSVITNPLRWNLGKIDINVGVQSKPAKQQRSIKPEIQHLFRPAEKRPAEIVSVLFTAATVAPFLILLILWLRIGINFKNFTVIALPFHLGFGAILGLFTLFWLKLDMFTTCAWLIPIGGFTFLAGNKLLSHIANRNRKPEKAEK